MLFPLDVLSLTNKGPTGEAGVSWGIGWISEVVLRDFNGRMPLSRDWCFSFSFLFYFLLSPHLKEWYSFKSSLSSFQGKEILVYSYGQQTFGDREMCIQTFINRTLHESSDRYLRTWKYTLLSFFFF